MPDFIPKLFTFSGTSKPPRDLVKNADSESVGVDCKYLAKPKKSQVKTTSAGPRTTLKVAKQFTICSRKFELIIRIING